MKKNKMHKIDLIFIIGVIVISFLGGLIDHIYWKDVTEGGFPIFSLLSILGSYVLWLILYIYSSLKFKEKYDKPKYVKGFMFFLLPWIHIIFIVIFMMILSILLG